MNIESKIINSFKKVKHELEDHLEAINENTNEIQSNYETVCDIESKLDKINQRIDKIELMLRNLFIKDSSKEEYKISPLDEDEKELFLSLYLQEEKKGSVTFEDLSEESGKSLEEVGELIKSIMRKGIPITTKYINNVAYLKLETSFKKAQAKENIVGIEV